MFGVKRIPLPKDEYGLDEDGWIDVRTRLTVRAAYYAERAQGRDDGLEISVGLVLALVAGWSIKGDGESLPFDEQHIPDLPLQVLNLLNGQVKDGPFGRLNTSTTSGSPSS